MIFAAIADWAEQKQFPVEFMCREPGVSMAGYYAWRRRSACPRAKTEAALTSLIRQIWDRLSGNPGVRRIHAGLAAMGRRVARKRVWRLMRATGLQGRHPRAWKKTTIHGDAPVDAPDLIGRDFTASKPNQRWCGDISYAKGNSTMIDRIVHHADVLTLKGASYRLRNRGIDSLPSIRTTSDNNPG